MADAPSNLNVATVDQAATVAAAETVASTAEVVSVQPAVPVPAPSVAPSSIAAPTVVSAATNGTASVVAPRPAPPVLQPGVTVPTAPRPSSKSKKKKGGGGSQGNQGENTGRWTAEEHRLFLQGLEQHGKGWKKIASLIKSRTVVQIRTHAQKYFQKLAKARQNGEEGDVTMEGRGGVASVTSASDVVAAPKRRKQVTGTKRKAIQTVVSSAQRQGKKLAAAQAASGVLNPVAPLPAVAPTLAHFVVPADIGTANGANDNGATPVTSTDTVSGPALEDSLFRFLTPCPPGEEASDPQVNNVARQAGANPITLPQDNAGISGGENSPTGVNELSIYPSWTDAKETPSWYAKGADVDALLDVGDALDWLADNGDPNETYEAPPLEESEVTDISMPTADHQEEDLRGVKQSSSVSTLPRVESNMETMVPSLPSIFHNESTENLLAGAGPSSVNLKASASVAMLDAHLQVFDTPLEEHAFVSTILEDSHDSTDHLPSLDD